MHLVPYVLKSLAYLNLNHLDIYTICQHDGYIMFTNWRKIIDKDKKVAQELAI